MQDAKAGRERQTQGGEMNTFRCANSQQVAKEALWLAWNACKYPIGMGVFQDKPSATKEDVIDNILNDGDYPSSKRFSNSRSKINADYVFGRMTKLGCSPAKDGIQYPDDDLDAGYQSWCWVYPTYDVLFKAAVDVLEDA